MSVKPLLEKALDTKIQDWYTEHLSLMTKVETNALQGLPPYASSIAKLNLIKDVAGLAKDGVAAFTKAGEDHKLAKFVGSWKFSVPMFAFAMAQTLYEDHYKHMEAVANFNLKQHLTRVDLAHRDQLKRIKDNLKGWPFCRELVSQVTSYLDKAAVFGPLTDVYLETFLKNYLYYLGVFPKPSEMYEVMMKGYGSTVKNIKALFEASYHHPGPKLSLGSVATGQMHGSIMYSDGGAPFPIGYDQATQTDPMFTNKWLKNSNNVWQYLETSAQTPQAVKSAQDRVLASASDLECRVVKYSIHQSTIIPMGGYIAPMGTMNKKTIVWCRKLRWKASSPKVTKNTPMGKIGEKQLEKALRDTIVFTKKTHGHEVQINTATASAGISH